MSEFTPSTMLQKYMNAKPRDMYSVVGALMGYIDADPHFKTDEFKQAVKYVLNNGVSRDELFAEFDDSKRFEDDPSKWDKSYYAYARIYLQENFCEKRIENVEKVARKLYPPTSEPKTPDKNVQKNVPARGEKRGAQSTGKKRKTNQAYRHTDSPMPVGIVIAIVLIVLILVIAAVAAVANSQKKQKERITMERHTAAIQDLSRSI